VLSFGEVRAALRLFRNVPLLRLWIPKLTDVVSALQLIICLEKLGVLGFTSTPRSLEEISSFLGGVKRTDLLQDIFETLKELKVFRVVDGKYVVNWWMVEKFFRLKAKHPALKPFNVTFQGVEHMAYRAALTVLRGGKVDLTSPEIATIFYFQTHHPVFDIGRRALLDLGGGKSLKGKTILDVGCGFGAEPVTILDYLDFDCNLICIDFSPNVVDECMHTPVERIAGKPLPSPKLLMELENVSFVTVDPSAERWPIPDESVDVAFTFSYLHRCDHPQRAIRECARILKRNGRFLLTTMIKKGEKLTVTDVAIRLFGGNRSYSRREIRKFLRNAGLEDVKIRFSFFVTARKS